MFASSTGSNGICRREVRAALLVRYGPLPGQLRHECLPASGVLAPRVGDLPDGSGIGEQVEQKVLEQAAGPAPDEVAALDERLDELGRPAEGRDPKLRAV